MIHLLISNPWGDTACWTWTVLTQIYIAMVFKDFFEVRWAHVRVHLVLFLVFRRLLRLLPLIFCMVDALRHNKVRVSSHSASFFYCCCLCDLHAHTPPIPLSLNPMISPFFSGDDLNEDCAENFLKNLSVPPFSLSIQSFGYVRSISFTLLAPTLASFSFVQRYHPLRVLRSAKWSYDYLFASWKSSWSA